MATSRNIWHQLWLLETIYSYGPISREGINEIWKRHRESDGKEIARRTLARHFRELEQLFNISIKYDKKYQYYISNPENLHRQIIQSQLLANLQEASFLSRFRGLGTKIQVEEVKAGDSYLPIIGEALEENRTLMMTYQKFTDSEPYTVEIEPYCLKLKDRRWYIIARKVTEDNVKVFSLDRIIKLGNKARKSAYLGGFDADTFFNNYYGIYVEADADVEEVVIRTTPLQAKYLRTLPLHRSQYEEAECEFHYRLVITPDLENELLKMSENTVVVKPEKLRVRILEKMRKAREMWESVGSLSPALP